MHPTGPPDKLASMSREMQMSFDVQSAHRHFSADCFNRAWTFIEKPDHTAAEAEEMLLLAMASLWHWTQRSDCTDEKLSVGNWQVSRAYALAGRGAEAMRHGQRSLELAAESSPFYLGYAHEALARAALVLNDRTLLAQHLNEARRLAAEVSDAHERDWLEQDLKSLHTGGDGRPTT
jgi:hypothetical protein